MGISRARTIAFDVLLRVANQNAYADEALRSALGTKVSNVDAGLATELTLGVLRWQRLLDFIVGPSLKKTSDSLDIEVRLALRLGAYQLLFLDRVPARAAIYESVELTKRARKGSAASLVNAVLRKTAKEWPSAEVASDHVASLVAPDLPIAEQLGIQYSHPTWMVERWVGTFGEDRTRNLLQANNRAPVTSCSLLDQRLRENSIGSLEKVGCHVRPGRLLRDAWVLAGGNPAASEAVREGWVVIQDEASQAVAHLLGVEPGDRVLDLCAAPGGKTLILALAAGAQGQVVAADLHEHRVRAMKERCEQAGARNVETLILDGSQPLPFERPFERILVDVPCSGTGTLARHPEIRWKLRGEDLANLRDRQMRLLLNAIPHLAPGGRLVYSTCSLETEENELVIREVLRGLSSEYHLTNARAEFEHLLKDPSLAARCIAADGFFRTFPPESGTEGFFAATIQRGKSKD